MKIKILKHAKRRMNQYNIDFLTLEKTLKNPDDILKGHSNRNIAQKSLNKHLLRVIFEEEKDIYVVVTTYKARGERYEV